MAYQNARAYTGCDGFNTGLAGRAYNTTVAYNPGELSTSRCALYGNWKAINYTEMQHPPPNTLVTDCMDIGKGYYNADPSWDPEQVATTPRLSWPSNINLLVPSWVTCTPALLGIFDPPKVLGQATAMAPVTSFTIPAAVPGASVVPHHAPATPTPDSATPQGNTLQPASSSESNAATIATSQPNVASGPQGQLRSSLLNVHTTHSGPVPASSAQKPLSDDRPFGDRTDDPKDTPKNSPSYNNEIPGSSRSAISNRPAQNEPQKSNFPAIDDPETENGKPSHENPPVTVSYKHDPNSNGASIILPPPQPTAQFYNQNHESPSSTSAKFVDSIPIDNLGGILASAFGHGPSLLTAPVADDPKIPQTSREIFEAGSAVSDAATQFPVIVNGVTTRLQPGTPGSSGAPIMHIGGQDITFSQIPSQFVLNGHTLTPGGSLMTASRDTIQLGAPEITHIPSAPDALSPSAMVPVYTVGSETIIPNPSEIPIKGSTIREGGPAVTIAGIPVSLQSSGNLVIGDSTVPAQITPPHPGSKSTPALAPIYTLGEQIFTANPTAKSIAGITISPDESGITISGTPVRLETSGVLLIGQSTISISPTSTLSSSTTASVLPSTSNDQASTGTSDVVSRTMIISDGAEATIGGTVVSVQVPKGSSGGDSTGGKASESSKSGAERTQGRALLSIFAGSLAILFSASTII